MLLSAQRALPVTGGASPRQRRGVARADGLTPAQRNATIGVIALLHVAAAWGLLQVREVREAAHEVAPIFAALITPPAPVPPVPPPPMPVQPVKTKPPPAPLITAPPNLAAAAFVAPPALLEPALASPPVAAVTAVEAPPAPPAPPPPPKLIPASAVQYLEPPVLDYPGLSRRLGENGRVSIRVYIDAEGRPSIVQLSRSSGHARLDDAALAAVRQARFKPYTENGVATAGWASIPLDFELEK